MGPQGPHEGLHGHVLEPHVGPSCAWRSQSPLTGPLGSERAHKGSTTKGGSTIKGVHRGFWQGQRGLGQGRRGLRQGRRGLTREVSGRAGEA